MEGRRSSVKTQAKRDMSAVKDVVIVGAGISGTYTAWTLGQLYPNWNIHIYEASNRIGGRLQSVNIPGVTDFTADLGAMRFRYEDHPRLTKLVRDLNLKTVTFTTPNEDDTLFYLREKLLSKTDMNSGNVPFNMTEEERKHSHDTRELQQYWNDQILKKKTANNNNLEQENYMKSSLNGEKCSDKDDYYHNDGWYYRLCTDNQPAYTKGVTNAFYEVASPDAIEYISHRNFHCTDYLNNTNYGEFCETEAKEEGTYSFLQHSLKRHQKGTCVTLADGFEQLVTSMMELFLQANNHRVHMNQCVESIHYDNKGTAYLTFVDTASTNIEREWCRISKRRSRTHEVQADVVFLAVGADALKHVKFRNVDVKMNVSTWQPGVIGSPVMKTFLAYDYPWWRKGGKRQQFKELEDGLRQIGTDLACGTLIDMGTDSKTGKAVLLSYNESDKNYRFWKPLQDPKDELVPTKYHLQELNKMLSRIFEIPVSDLPKPYFSVCKIWHDPPVWSGWYHTAPGYDYPKVKENIQKHVTDKELYIVGDSYSDMHAWCEGALQTTQQVLQKYFHVKLAFK